MDVIVYGPDSVRHNDLFMLGYSKLERQWEALFEGDALKLKIFGDSAYNDGPVFGTGGGRGMASVREAAEWSYKDLKGQWKYLDYRHVLQLRKQPIAKITFVCMLLRNAYVTMNGCQSTEYFVMIPPTFKEWLEQGPMNSIPISSCFHSNFVHPEDDPDWESDDEGEGEEDA